MNKICIYEVMNMPTIMAESFLLIAGIDYKSIKAANQHRAYN